MRRLGLTEGRKRLQEAFIVTDEGAEAFRQDYPDGYTYKGVTIKHNYIDGYSVSDRRYGGRKMIGEPKVDMVYDGKNNLGFGINWSGSGSWNASLRDTQAFILAVQEAMEIAEHLNKLTQQYER